MTDIQIIKKAFKDAFVEGTVGTLITLSIAVACSFVLRILSYNFGIEYNDICSSDATGPLDFVGKTIATMSRAQWIWTVVLLMIVYMLVLWDSFYTSLSEKHVDIISKYPVLQRLVKISNWVSKAMHNMALVILALIALTFLLRLLGFVTPC